MILNLGCGTVPRHLRLFRISWNYARQYSWKIHGERFDLVMLPVSCDGRALRSMSKHVVFFRFEVAIRIYVQRQLAKEIQIKIIGSDLIGWQHTAKYKRNVYRKRNPRGKNLPIHIIHDRARSIIKYEIC